MNGCLMIGYGAVGAFAGLIVGLLAGVILAVATAGRNRNVGVGQRVGLGFSVVSGAGTVGFLFGGIAGVVIAYFESVQDGPSHGYPDRSAYRNAEMEAREKRLDPVLASLEKHQAERGRYPAKLQELIDGKYLDALPPEKLANDHLGQPGRVKGDEAWYWYDVSPVGNEFALRIACVFTEDLWAAMPLRVGWHYLSRNPGWAERIEGPWPPWPPAFGAPNPKAAPEVAPPPREVKRP